MSDQLADPIASFIGLFRLPHHLRLVGITAFARRHVPALSFSDSSVSSVSSNLTRLLALKRTAFTWLGSEVEFITFDYYSFSHRG